MDFTNVKIETERLMLVPVSKEHILDIFKEFKLPITQYMNYSSAGSVEELTERQEKWDFELKQGTKLSLTVFLKEGNEFLGRFSIENTLEKNPEMGGWLKQSAHGNGYGREAALGLKNWADKNLTHENLIWPCAKVNLASRKLAEHLGGTVQKEFIRKTESGNEWEAVEYWIPCKG